MKAESRGTYLHLVCIEPGEKTETRRELSARDWTDAPAPSEGMEVSEHGVHSVQWWTNERAAYVRALRARVQAGTYRVDSVSLAERLLDSSWPSNDFQ